MRIDPVRNGFPCVRDAAQRLFGRRNVSRFEEVAEDFTVFDYTVYDVQFNLNAARGKAFFALNAECGRAAVIPFPCAEFGIGDLLYALYVA